MMADTPRQGDLDGRGNLSQWALIEFVVWFLRVAFDQVQFMASLFELDTLMDRLHALVAQRDSMKPGASRLLDETLVRGEIERGEAPELPGFLSACGPTSAERTFFKEGIPLPQHRRGQCPSATSPADSLEVLFQDFTRTPKHLRIGCPSDGVTPSFHLRLNTPSVDLRRESFALCPGQLGFRLFT